jgi:oligopeptidase A
LISEHVDTKETLPDHLYHKLLATKNFQSGLHIQRQLEFAIFDFRLHLEYDSLKSNQIQSLLDEVRQMLALKTPPSFNRFQNTFSHIFAGGYAAGYYSYLWADILACDAYAKFEETGIFNPTTGQAFLQNILEQGGTRHPMDLFIAFRGREPSIEALLRHNGLCEENK